MTARKAWKNQTRSIPNKEVERSLRRRAAVASTLLAWLELARNGIVTLDQQTLRQPILVSHADRDK